MTASDATPLERDVDNEHVILVAFEVEAASRLDAHQTLMATFDLADICNIETGTSTVTALWVAEDDRLDGSDRDSAVFCTAGRQSEAADLLFHADLTEDHNIIPWLRPNTFKEGR